jgi:hypothetical protein
LQTAGALSTHRLAAQLAYSKRCIAKMKSCTHVSEEQSARGPAENGQKQQEPNQVDILGWISEMHTSPVASDHSTTMAGSIRALTSGRPIIPDTFT